jgi:hypothetical protein
MKSKALAYVVLLSVCVIGCGGAVDTGDGSEAPVDEAATVGETDQALTIGTNLGSSSTTSVQECLPQQSCHFECTDPVDENDIYHCKVVCKTVCTRI